jgi:hypothetical protein
MLEISVFNPAFPKADLKQLEWDITDATDETKCVANNFLFILTFTDEATVLLPDFSTAELQHLVRGCIRGVTRLRLVPVPAFSCYGIFMLLRI